MEHDEKDEKEADLGEEEGDKDAGGVRGNAEWGEENMTLDTLQVDRPSLGEVGVFPAC